MKILVINSGSSSIKFKLYYLPASKLLCSGIIERIGEPKGLLKIEISNHDGEPKEMIIEEPFSNHQQGLNKAAELLLNPENQILDSPDDIVAVGHRVVHGGEYFSKATEANDEVLERIASLVPLAPLHNPANLEGIKTAMRVFPEARQVCVFDSAFHQTIPNYAYRYGIPKNLYEDHGLRLYGMHGTSHHYVSIEAARYLQKPLEDCNLISIHLGNGCSMAAIQGGKSIDTSMGLSPLPGLLMGTRSGDIDPAVIFYLHANLDMSVKDIDKLLNKESGLKGLTGSNDLRDITKWLEEGNPDAQLAIEMYTYRIRKYIGAYATVLGKLDAIIFTAGVGENAAIIRERSCQNLEIFGVHMDLEKNSRRDANIRMISAENSPVKVMVVPTNEELAIAQQTYELIHQ